ncbi:MAG: flavodoxin-dependent (E)-4-hydroxy-3-methylbut-2-enyl-diphosphate synthase [Clostridia bacterium]|nr:flavodoxin-dependent (E)-4-hydroxy-3-methylbut-2-enyl-diphosphate synthase [Clostridia bacterium]
MRRITRTVYVNGRQIGGGSPVTVQSMLNTKTDDIESSCRQIDQLLSAGCDIIRFTVPDVQCARAVYEYKSRYPDVPFVADIHFDHRIALACIEAGIDKIRINPGNIGDESGVKAVACAAKAKGIPIRIGVNSGSLERHILSKYGRPTPEAIAESAFYHASLFEKFDFSDIVISVKSSDVKVMIEANRIIANRCDYPLHLGVTEAGTASTGTIKSAVGIGSLLCDGIGDTIRVSLTDDPVNEVHAAKRLLDALGMSDSLISTVSCPTCGRTGIDLIGLCRQFDEIKGTIKPSRPVKVALMGCVVNGPGEARECDIGIAAGKGEALLFMHGEPVRKISYENILQTLKEEIEKL